MNPETTPSGVASQYPQMDWTPERVARFWDYQSNFPENYFTNRVGADLIRKTERFLPKGARILDYGCGMGFLTGHLLDRGHQVMGLDFSVDSVEGVRRKYQGNPRFLGADLPNALLSRAETFDVIYVVEVIEHLDESHLRATMENLVTLLSPGGRAIFTTPNEERLEDSRVFCAQCNHTFHHMQHVRRWTAGSLSAYLADNGLRPQSVFTTAFSMSGSERFVQGLKKFLRRLAGRPVPAPNLVAVCSRD